MVATTTNSSLGELILHHRKQAEMTLVQLEKLTKVDKASLSRIESGQIKRPSLEKLMKIGVILNIPDEEIIDRYIQVEERQNILVSILHKLIKDNHLPLINKAAMKVLKSTEEDSEELVKMLYEMTETIKEPSVKLSLYELIISYSRAHGIMPYIAMGLLQVYLIERDDFTKLRATYESGKSVLFFANSLTSEERGVLYYKLAVHAYNLCLFQESVEMGEKALGETISDTKMHANTIFALCNSCYHLGEYEQTKEYLIQYKVFPLPRVKDNTKGIEAALHLANGNHQIAISIMQDTISNCGDFALLHVVNLLITLYFETNNQAEIEKLFRLEEKLLLITYVTPFKKAEMAHYFKLKGDYFILIEDIRQGVNCYLEAATRYAKVDLIAKESECLRLVMNIHTLNKEAIDVSTFEKLEIYYDNKTKTSN
ncbi:helix-turn-helix domain-containing protein [Chengkuizengella axinellae]|uniref:Helix-turn-helix transcriptional regulator n=1 Tax=Chengkuizengella axinellae TaxID=3064388 RepID=A0ABT9J6J6_9BACL|nr:helix-turn-helix transcriptional regulator [Chengkuizengella sp. 2205SS18-9]MDP5277173.1 helix-turn-helix transcriptional regulator [Chengkuizengella sp. 2205SS18-9]